MSTPLTHVGQTARPEKPEGSQQDQQQNFRQMGSPSAPRTEGQQEAAGASDRARHAPQQQADFFHRTAEQRWLNAHQQRQVDAEDAPASNPKAPT